jgi:hypothetical protein
MQCCHSYILYILFQDLVDCVTALQNVFSSTHSAAKSDLFCECLFSWALLLSISPDSLVEECVEK